MLKEKTFQAEKECTRLQLSVRINYLNVHVLHIVYMYLYFNVCTLCTCSSVVVKQ